VKIKLTRCHVCNATKARRSPTAYVYCDFCGALTDFDFQIAISDKRSKLPGPEFERLKKKLTPQLEEALAKKDKARYLALNREIYTEYVKACPAACPPRVGDPVYREKYVEQSARGATEAAFDDEMNAASARQATAMKKLKWVPGGKMGQTCQPDTFWALYDTVIEITEVGKRMAARTGLVDINPDGDSPVNEKLGISMFVQGWLPYLKKPEVEKLMERSGLSGQYVDPEPLVGDTAPCGVCKADVTMLLGAKQCVCDSCGHLLRADVTVPCTQCAAKVLMPTERTTFQCPFCNTELRSMTWTNGQLTR
jgi:hypothetical protein